MVLASTHFKGQKQLTGVAVSGYGCSVVMLGEVFKYKVALCDHFILC